jgi:GH43 family beta-xylosidase
MTSDCKRSVGTALSILLVPFIAMFLPAGSVNAREYVVAGPKLASYAPDVDNHPLYRCYTGRHYGRSVECTWEQMVPRQAGELFVSGALIQGETGTSIFDDVHVPPVTPSRRTLKAELRARSITPSELPTSVNWLPESRGLTGVISTAFANAEPAAELSGNTGIYAADPSVIHTDDGYVAVESREGHTLYVRVAPSLEEIAKAPPVRIWTDIAGLGEVWAPEIVSKGGNDYAVYFAAGRGSKHRMYSIASKEPAANYGDATEIALPENKWAIDGLPFTYRDVNYFIWSGWQGDSDIQQDIFIAKLGADGNPAGPRVLIGSPDEPWENIAGETPSINEAPQPIADPAGQLHIVYSTNGSWGPNYCLADLRLRADSDPLDAEAWFESDGCLFGANEDTLGEGAVPAKDAKGIGHHSFILADGEVEHAGGAEGPRPFLYHGVAAVLQPSNFWAARTWFFGSYQWVPDTTYGSGETSNIGWSLRFSE